MENHEASATTNESSRTALTAHTPGPWSLKFEPPRPDYEHPYMRLVGGDSIGDENGIGGFHITGIISESDARLIAAAPDMLAALRSVKAYAEDYYNDILHKPQQHDGEYIDGIVQAIEDIDAAIAQATGAA